MFFLVSNDARAYESGIVADILGEPKMEHSRKKIAMICVIVGCSALAGIVTYRNSRGRRTGVTSLKRGELVWVKCNNPNCGAEYQIDKRDFYEYVEEHSNPMDLVEPPLVCKECGEESVYRAVKCEKCGHTFFYGSVRNDFADRCPKCGYSKDEHDRQTMAKRGD